MTFFSYINRQNLLIVQRLKSPHELQELRPMWKRFIGQFDAPDHAQARRIAKELHHG